MNPIDWIRSLYRQPAPGAICYSKGRWFYCPRGVEHDVLATILVTVAVLVLAFIVWFATAIWRGLV